MKMSKIFLLILIPFVGYGQKVPICKKHRAVDTFIIDVYSAYKQQKTYPLSTVAEGIEYIPLEKTEECIIGSSLKTIRITSKDIFVFDYELCYRFDRQGKFINKIGRIGRGPGECINPIDMDVDSVNHWVYLLDHDKLVKYNYDGSFVETNKLGFDSNKVLIHENSKFLLNDMFYLYAKAGKRFSLRFFSEEEGKVISKVACEKDDNIPSCICSSPMYRYNQNTFLKDYWSDTIFKVQDPYNIEAYATIQTGKFKHRDTDDHYAITGKENPKDKMIIGITYISETDRYIFLATTKGLFFYDKFSKETFCCNYTIKGEKAHSFTNDVVGGPHLWSNNFPKLTFHNNMVVTYNHAYEFFETNGTSRNSKPLNRIKGLSSGDNPVLVFVKIKS